MGAGMKSNRMVEMRLVFATSATLFLLACAEPPDSTQPPATRTNSPDLAIPGMAKKDILIYGPSLFGAPDNEATLAAAAGHSVTVADPVTWSAAVTGNMVVIGTDPITHQLQGQANQLTTNAINFAASGAATGLYMSLSCYYFEAPADTPVSVLSEFGDFRVQGQITPPLDACPNDVSIVAPGHPVVHGITKPGLDDWFCSIHEVFNAFPASVGVVVRDTPTALPYVIAGRSPKARLCAAGQEDKGNGEVEDENGGNGGDFDFDECDENHQVGHRDKDRNVDFHSTTKDGGPTFDLSVLKATTTGRGLNNGQPVTYTLIVTDLGIGPGMDLYMLTLRDDSGAIIYSRTGMLRFGDIVVRR